MKFLLLVTLFLFNVNCLNICDVHVTKESSETDLLTLLSFCASDDVCSYYFNQKLTTLNLTTFELLALPIYSNAGMDLNYVVDTLCELESMDVDGTALLKYLWTRELVYRRSTNTIFCGPSQTLKINEDNSVNCVCDPEADCEDADNDDSLLIALLVLLIAATSILLVMFCCNNQYFIRFIDINK